MIQLTRSHNLRILAGAFADKLKETAPVDPFISQNVIVPNLDTARWFKLFAAETNGIAANLECMLPAEWLWSQIRKIYPDLPELLPSDRQPMKWKLFQLLSSDRLREKFEILNQYVKDQPEERREQAVFQLARQIASVFDEYLVYRPEMMLRWQDGHSGKGDEKWQSELWRMLNDSWTNLGTEKKKNRAELFGDVFKSFINHQLETDDSLFVLNSGLLPMPIVKLLKEIGEQSDLFLYKIELSKELKKNNNELFQVFGRESESIHEVINILSPHQTVNLHSGISVRSELDHVKFSILNGESIKTASGFKKKNSGIEVRSCHSPVREIEVLHQFLLEKFEEDETLHPDDILIATPDVETYRPYIKAVFDQVENGVPQIPYQAGYSARHSDLGIERALLRLLNVIDSRYEFSEVIDLFMMKPVYQSYGISESDCQTLKRWMEENHVVWGLDANHRKEFDQPAIELQTWNSAQRRGWYGTLFGGEEGAAVNDLLLYQSIRTSNDQVIWSAFSNYLQKLETMKIEMKRKKKGTAWTSWLIHWLESLFGEFSLRNMEVQNVIRVIGQIQEHAECANCEIELPFSLFKSELISILDKHRASGAQFTNGVTFSSMVPVRSIPFKIIALIGLNGNDFPRKQTTPDFDLMAQHPLPGERNRKNEDRNLFLESVMAAGGIHYCSYIGQSPVDNEEIPPSTIVSEWVDVISKATGRKINEIINEEALSGFSRSNFESKKNYSGVYLQTARAIQNDENSISGLKLTQRIPLGESVDLMTIDDLTRFYSNPIRWFLRKRLEVSLRDPEQNTDEFRLDHLESHILFQRIFGWVLDEMPDQQIQQYVMQSGAVPLGWMGEKKVLEFKRNVKTALSELKDSRIHPDLEQISLDFNIGETRIGGNLISYSDKQFVDITPSGFSGKVAINSWIRHLAGIFNGCFEEKKSILFCELKKGEPVKKIFKPVQNAEEILSELVELYREGLSKPQKFFPQTLYAFEEKVQKGDPVSALNEAAKKFNTGDFSFGESNDLAIQTLLGPGIKFQDEFISERYRNIIGRMINHMGDPE